MTPSEFLSRLSSFLKTMVWFGTANKIFGSNAVKVVPAIPSWQTGRYPSPCAFIIDKGDISDPEHPGLIDPKFNILLFVQALADPYGEGSLLDGNRTLNTSKGAGAKDIEKEVIKQLTELTQMAGDKVCIILKSRVSGEFLNGNHVCIYKHLVFEGPLLSVY